MRLFLGILFFSLLCFVVSCGTNKKKTAKSNELFDSARVHDILYHNGDYDNKKHDDSIADMMEQRFNTARSENLIRRENKFIDSMMATGRYVSVFFYVNPFTTTKDHPLDDYYVRFVLPVPIPLSTDSLRKDSKWIAKYVHNKVLVEDTVKVSRLYVVYSDGNPFGKACHCVYNKQLKLQPASDLFLK